MVGVSVGTAPFSSRFEIMANGLTIEEFEPLARGVALPAGGLSVEAFEAIPSLEAVPTADFLSAPVIETPTETLLDPERGKTFRLPLGLSEQEAEFVITRDADGVPADHFIGPFNVGRAITEPLARFAEFQATAERGVRQVLRGAFAGGFQATRVPGGLRKQARETSLQLLRGDMDLGDALEFIAFGSVSDVFAWATGTPREEIVRETKSSLASINEALAEKDIRFRLMGLGPPEEGGFVGWMYDLGQGGTSLAVAVGLGLLTGSLTIAATVFAAIQQTQIYEEYRARVDKDGNPKFTAVEARQFADLAGLAEGVLEKVGLTYLFRFLKQSRIFRRVVGGLTTEAVQEGAQQTAEEALTQITGARDVDIRAGIERTLYAASLGAVLGGGAGAVISLAESAAKDEGLPPELARALADKINENADLLREEAASIITDLNSDIAINPKTQEQVSEIIRKFVQGEEINLEEVLGKETIDVATALAGVVQDVAARTDISKEVEAGRIAELSREINVLDQQIGDIETRIEERDAADKPVKALQNRLDKLAERRRTFEEEQADLQVPPTRAGLLPEFEPALQKGRVKPESQVRVRARILEKLNIRATGAAVAAIRKGFRAGDKAAKTNVKEAQTILVTLIEKSGLAAKDKAKFLRTIKNIQTREQLEKRLPGIQSRVMRLLDVARGNALRAALKKTVRKTKPRKISGKPVGKFTPEVQKILDRARKILATPVGKAEEQLKAALREEAPSAEAAFENKLLAVAARDENVSTDEIETLLVNLERIKTEGAAEAKRLFTARREEEQATIAEASRATTQNADIDIESTTKLLERIAARVRGGRTGIASLWDAWDEILDKVFNKEGVDVGDLIKRLRMTRQLTKEKEILIRWEKAFTELGMKAYGLKTQRQLVDILYRHLGRQDLGLFVDKSGHEVRLEFSIGEAIDLYMETQNEDTNASLGHEKVSAFTDDMVDSVLNLLTEQDRAYGEALIEFYDGTTYPETNAVYRRQYGIDLPKVMKYKPLLRDRGGKPIEETAFGDEKQDNFFNDIAFRRTIPSALKSRTPNLLPRAKQNATAAAHRHMHDLAHFIATAEQARFLNNVFSSRERNGARLRKEIARRHGKNMLAQIDSALRDFSSGYLNRGVLAERQVNLFNQVFAKSVLAIKATIGMKQLTSLFAMGEDIPVKDFVAGMVDFTTRPREVVKFLFENSPVMQERGSSIDLEFGRLGAAEKDILTFKRRQSLDNALMILIRWGDRAPIYMGGWAAYKHARKAKAQGGLGMNKADAIALFEDKVESTQQSRTIDKLSFVQRLGGFGRSFTLFFTSRLALFRGEMRAIRQFRRGKISAAEFGKRIAYYHFIMPSLIQIIASGMRFEPEKQLAALLLGQVNNAVIFGEVLMNATLALLGERKFRVDFGVPLFDWINDATLAAIDLLSAIGTGALEEIMEASGELADELGKIKGLPVAQTRNAIIGGMELVEEGKFEEGTKQILGWSPRMAEESSK